MSETNTFYCTFVGNQFIICECGETFASEDLLRVHLENDPHVPNTFTEYKCGECSKVYDTEQECIDHQELEHVPQAEPDPEPDPPAVPSQSKAEIYYIPKDQLYLTLDQLHGVENQVTVKEEPEYGGQELLYVEDEQEVIEQTEDVYGLISRIKNSPFDVAFKPRGRKQTVQVTEGAQATKKKKNYVHKNVVCETCGKKYASNAALRYHQRVHTGVRPYQCTYCPKNFTMALFLQIHVRTHTGERPYKCAACPKAFSNRAALLRHDRVHTGAKPYECPQCGKFFTQSNSMKLHVHTVHLKQPAPYKSARRKAELRARSARRAPPGSDMKVKNAMEVVKSEPSEGEEGETGEVLAESEQVYYADLAPDAEVTYELVYQ